MWRTPLFQQSVLKKFIDDLNKTAIQTGWNLFTAHFHEPAKQPTSAN